MLELRNIVKDYVSGDEVVHALKGVSVRFRDSEFVSILGQSGCGKTTLLNIIGGLDRYTSGDLVINGRSTSDYNDADWDTYRNHSVGFVFQSYNLISHQTVLRNVELALTISGVGREERTRRAREALEAVGLGDQVNKLPNQLSGGQMQRVAIARALVNNPEIVLADEPTGALDSATSVQVMDILKEVARDRLVIMVTHNPELAQEYSTRVIHLLDGVLTSDSNPFVPEGETGDSEGAQERTGSRRERRRAERAEDSESGKGKRRMSLPTALGLSMRNLLTKKARTILTAFAGSIGIIGIALILSLSNGTQEYINRVEQDTLSSYPIQIDAMSMDMSALMSSMSEAQDEAIAQAESTDSDSNTDKITSVGTRRIMTGIISMVGSGSTENDLASFRSYIEEGEGHRLYELVNDVSYSYASTPLYVYSADSSQGVLKVNPSTLLSNIGLGQLSSETDATTGAGSILSNFSSMSPMMSSVDVFTQLLSNDEVLANQYDVLAGRMPTSYDELVIITNKRGLVSDYLLYALGLRDQSEVADMLDAIAVGKAPEEYPAETYDFDELLGMEFKLVLPTDCFRQQEDGTWVDVRDDDVAMAEVLDGAQTLRVVGIICPNANASISQPNGAVGYTAELPVHVVEGVNESEIAKQQLAEPEIDVFTGLPFRGTQAAKEAQEAADAAEAADPAAESAGDAGDETGGDEASSDSGDSKASTTAGSGSALSSMTSMFAGAASALGGAGSSAGQADASQDDSAQTAEAQGAGASLDSIETVDDLYALADSMGGAMGSRMRSGIEQAQAQGYSDEEILAMFEQYLPMMGSMAGTSGATGLGGMSAVTTGDDQTRAIVSSSSYAANLTRLGVSSIDEPTSITITPKDFDSKEAVSQFIEDYNQAARDAGEDSRVIQYTDYVGLMMSSVSSVIDAITYILIAFVAISLIVSSIMIGIITYISVLERTKEIGILRSIGASKRDVSRVFNAETFVIGLIAGVIGVVVTMLLDIPANIIIENMTGVHNLAVLPWWAAIVLVVVSVILTLIGGLIPSRLAANRDPVLALRTE